MSYDLLDVAMVGQKWDPEQQSSCFDGNRLVILEKISSLIIKQTITSFFSFVQNTASTFLPRTLPIIPICKTYFIPLNKSARDYSANREQGGVSTCKPRDKIFGEQNKIRR